MKKNAHMGSSFNDFINGEMRKDSKLRAHILESREKARLANLLRKIRLREHYTQQQLANLTGVSQAYIARLEPHATAPSRMPSVDAYLKILNAIGYETTFSVRKLRKAA